MGTSTWLRAGLCSSEQISRLAGFRVACGDGAIEVTRAQRLGKRAMSAEDFLRGMPLPERLT